MNCLVIQEIVKEALQRFLSNDAKELLDYCPNEQTFSAKIAMYIHQILAEKRVPKGINVDCEYNKLHDVRKPSPEKYPFKSIRPDIVIHKRGCTEKNLFYCELKIGKPSWQDIAKVKFSLGQPLNYQIAAIIHDIERSQLMVSWYKTDDKLCVVEENTSEIVKENALR